MKCECGGDMKHHDKTVRIVREKYYCYIQTRRRSRNFHL